MTRVLNLRTLEVRLYSIAPERAVVCAHEFAKGNMNTWTYDFSKAVFSGPNNRTVSCGDFSAPMNEAYHYTPE